MPLEKIWEEWFRSVAGLVPTRVVQQQICDSFEAASLHTVNCLPAPNDEPVLDQQLLFSVYVHSSRINFTDFEPSSVFSGSLLANQAEAQWGDTTPAVRLLLAESLKDRLNTGFALLSDTDIPLYPAKLTYNQLIQEKVSRVDACHGYDLVNLHRYTCAMAEDGIDLHHWRKSNLFMHLIRKHAELFHEDEQIYQSFRTKCSGVRVDEELQTFRGCLTDEHYYASLLAAKELAHETDCIGAITLANFTESVAGHPKLYTDADVDSELYMRLRKTIPWLPQGVCANASTFRATDKYFMSLPVTSEVLDCQSLLTLKDSPTMDAVCHLFYRKFDKSVVQPLLHLMTQRGEESAILVQ